MSPGMKCEESAAVNGHFAPLLVLVLLVPAFAGAVL